MKRPLIQFGKKHIIKEKFGEGYAYKVGNATVSPAVRSRSKKTVQVRINSLTKVHVFSNGSEGEGWFYNNCTNCSKDGNCALQYRLMDMPIPFKTMERIGYTRLDIQANGANFGDLKRRCNEREDG